MKNLQTRIQLEQQLVNSNFEMNAKLFVFFHEHHCVQKKNIFNFYHFEARIDSDL